MNIKREIYKNVLVFIQFAGLLVIVLTGDVFAKNIFLLCVEIAGIVLAVWALQSMKFNNVNVYPDLKKDAKFVTAGPYKIIRHPMYSSIILAVLPLIIDQFSLLRLTVYLIIVADLVVKLNYEERLLKSHFDGYSQYCENTYRIIPFVY